MANTTSTTIPAPWSWRPSSYWDGNDGSWNTFIIEVGTPQQPFRVLPSTAGQETWVLNAAGCTANDPVNCTYTRGALGDSTGYDTNASSTWVPNGIFSLTAQETVLGYTGNGAYGFDAIKLGNESHALSLDHQVIASIADKSYYLAQFGLGHKPINFTTFTNPLDSYMTNLVGKGMIPSSSFGYTAGAAYRGKAPASLTLGGYDTSRFTPSNVSFAMNGDDSRPLQVGVQKISAQNTLLGSAELLPSTTYHFIDSTVPHIWLPDDAIAAFTRAFGLNYDNTTDLFLVNDTVRSDLLTLQPSVTFTLATDAGDSSAVTQTVSLPYAAFDLQASYPFYDTPTNYFPIRRAVNDTQYTIGRTFLQEAYITVDWERQNFTVAQTTFDTLDSPKLVPILSIEEAAARNATSIQQARTGSGLGGGAIAGIVVGAIVLLAFIAVAVLFGLRRRRRRQQIPASASDAQHDYDDDSKMTFSGHATELHSDSPASEMPAYHTKDTAELHGASAWRGAYGKDQQDFAGHYGSLTQNAANRGALPVEAPGCEGRRYELPDR
ncbi:hypothetical protein B0A48_00286 [Cryoendolithus antarcticus]|uniref:Peptidase A1 domain-containing protein n=1 Tax=Cryoendolithus antarcticus TaxID=1507870 RepID=A0A1V8TUB4_9PEZI|nr:hypothetical protein B0A48_00286 [Cryoendolithus antarcticus]